MSLVLRTSFIFSLIIHLIFRSLNLVTELLLCVNNFGIGEGQASQVNKNPDKFQIIISATPNFKSSSRDESRFPFSGTIDEIGSDIQRLKDMGVDHIVFAYIFLPIGRNVNEMIETSKQLSKFAR